MMFATSYCGISLLAMYVHPYVLVLFYPTEFSDRTSMETKRSENLGEFVRLSETVTVMLINYNPTSSSWASLLCKWMTLEWSCIYYGS